MREVVAVPNVAARFVEMGLDESDLFWSGRNHVLGRVAVDVLVAWINGGSLIVGRILDPEFDAIRTVMLHYWLRDEVGTIPRWTRTIRDKPVLVRNIVPDDRPALQDLKMGRGKRGFL